ncbi:WecB/TagA/CpsF family glycosyltransferase [Algisphaera agarilytica]|uniref:N-acetylglucosaminyldiphosphoundecaprenol N-acetyl-beta-D-mannosaminyltransferase n=1 Tax=Algisphaera agarilytica TaxID=1385975 RepID=A0A7X0LLY8_9BACT|nr:WecB/TagA/CpsF family glycosyltransferase [Algisphaera agarilytica]MBB6430458.1 N-acetylglucosaminyldiphosphoundecaprenol N-acetyl-beta-D-mannosaminyltransferase [Algisphaera agarilytica]
MTQSDSQTDSPSPASSEPPPRPAGIDLRGVWFDRVTQAQAVDHIMVHLDAGQGGWVITSNLDHLLRSGRDPEFRAMLDECDLVVADGAPLVWASKIQGTPLPERVAGSEMVWSIAEAAANRDKSVFLLGGDPGTADASGEVLVRKYPNLRIAGTFCPPMGFEKDPEQMEAMTRALRESGADLVYVALGSPKQERLIREIREVLPGAWWLGVGISLSFIAGEVKQAPVLIRKFGMEWMHRMLQEPKRLARRYLIDGIPFAFVLISSSVLRRVVKNRAELETPAGRRSA